MKNVLNIEPNVLRNLNFSTIVENWAPDELPYKLSQLVLLTELEK